MERSKLKEKQDFKSFWGFSVGAISYSSIVKIHQDPRQDPPRSTKIHIKIHQDPRQDPPRSTSRYQHPPRSISRSTKIHVKIHSKIHQDPPNSYHMERSYAKWVPHRRFQHRMEFPDAISQVC
jgi:hypothetical protein